MQPLVNWFRRFMRYPDHWTDAQVRFKLFFWGVLYTAVIVFAVYRVAGVVEWYM